MKRYPLPDLLKGFAVFLIVPVHILELFIDYPDRESLFGKILLFLVLSSEPCTNAVQSSLSGCLSRDVGL